MTEQETTQAAPSTVERHEDGSFSISMEMTPESMVEMQKLISEVIGGEVAEPTAPELTDQNKALLDEVAAVVLVDRQDLLYVHLLKNSRRQMFELTHRIINVEPTVYGPFEVWASAAFPPNNLYVRTTVQIGREERIIGFIVEADGEINDFSRYSNWQQGQPIPDGHYNVTSSSQEVSIIDHIVDGETLGGRGVSVQKLSEADFFLFERVWVVGMREAEILRDLLSQAGEGMAEDG